MKRSIISVAIAAAAISAPAMAEDYSYYATLGSAHASNEKTTGYISDAQYNLHSYTFEGSLGYMTGKNTAIEFSVVTPNLQKKARPDINQIKFSAFRFFGDNDFKPYLTGGIGREKLEVPGEGTEVDLLLDVGAGLQYDFTERLFGRAEIRFDDMINTRPEHRSYGLEVGLRFGSTASTAPAKLQPEPMPQPEPEPVVVIVPPADTDNDGVIDDMDKCAATPAGVTVDSDGCPDFQGKLEGVTFETNSARLTINSQTILDEAATELKLYPDLDIEIAAYTDSMGADSYNQMLSQKRAESVLSYLVSKGVSPEQLTAVGYGEANPVASNETSAGRAQNRRVELVVKK